MINPIALPYARTAARRLRAADPVLARLMDKVGPCRLLPEPTETFDALLSSIVYQQLNGRAAATILGRVLDLFPSKKASPRRLLSLPPSALRKAGLSRNKLAALRDLAAKTLAGIVPARAQAERMSDQELISRLTEVRGIGVWTVHMLLIFTLGRPDVLPSGDFAIRSAFGRLYRKRGQPSPAAVERHGLRWAPYRTVASWYLWRSLD
ncbi:MAG: DNA-3-methyladenine glycosylase 2 family protein [Elusimicrobiota bacterium]|jgi:3-methyladenine DNA glycosylase/8-oxoguanine DNA glycosylase